MNFIGSKIIETERLILRPTEKKDLKILFDILLIPEVNKYYLTTKIGKSFEEDHKWQLKKLQRAHNQDVFQWSIVKKEDNRCIGQISVQEKQDSPVEIRDIGWFIDLNEQRKGYAYEAASKIIDFMFNEVRIEAIETSSAICNPASFGFMEKLGFYKRGNMTHKQKYTFMKELVDCYSYGITEKEYCNKKKNILIRK
ncbi:MAG: GNAT family protein [Bacilli bacterium]|nr:GNAT family protein [Bacilli bacterium]